jgi:transcription-repair coupling factor (superfamily II helicase)
LPTELIEFLERHPSFQQLLPAVDRPGVSLSGLHSSAAALVLTLLRKIRPRRFIWITDDNRSAEALCRELKWFHALLQAEGRIAVLPASEGDPYRGLSTHPDIARQRVVALWEALEGRCDVLIAPLRSWMQKLQEPDA